MREADNANEYRAILVGTSTPKGQKAIALYATTARLYDNFGEPIGGTFGEGGKYINPNAANIEALREVVKFLQERHMHLGEFSLVVACGQEYIVNRLNTGTPAERLASGYRKSGGKGFMADSELWKLLDEELEASGLTITARKPDMGEEVVANHMKAKARKSLDGFGPVEASAVTVG